MLAEDVHVEDIACTKFSSILISSQVNGWTDHTASPSDRTPTTVCPAPLGRPVGFRLLAKVADQVGTGGLLSGF